MVLFVEHLQYSAYFQLQKTQIKCVFICLLILFLIMLFKIIFLMFCIKTTMKQWQTFYMNFKKRHSNYKFKNARTKSRYLTEYYNKEKMIKGFLIQIMHYTDMNFISFLLSSNPCLTSIRWSDKHWNKSNWISIDIKPRSICLRTYNTRRKQWK